MDRFHFPPKREFYLISKNLIQKSSVKTRKCYLYLTIIYFCRFLLISLSDKSWLIQYDPITWFIVKIRLNQLSLYCLLLMLSFSIICQIILFKINNDNLTWKLIETITVIFTEDYLSASEIKSNLNNSIYQLIEKHSYFRYIKLLELYMPWIVNMNKLVNFVAENRKYFFFNNLNKRIKYLMISRLMILEILYFVYVYCGRKLFVYFFSKLKFQFLNFFLGFNCRFDYNTIFLNNCIFSSKILFYTVISIYIC